MRDKKAKATKQAKARVYRSICASAEASLPQNESQYTAFLCASCKHGFGVTTEASAKKLQPFCVKCGSENVNVVTQSEEIEIEDLHDVDDESLAALECPSCENNLIMHAETASEHNGRITCPVCASETLFTEPGEDVGDDEMIPDTEDEGLDDSVFSEDLDDDDDSDDAEDLEVEGEEEDLPVEDEIVDADDDADDAGDVEINDDAGETAEDDEDLGGDRPDEEEIVEDDGDEVTMNLVDLSLASVADKSVIRFTRIANRIVCFHNDVAIATLYQERLAKDKQEAFEQKAYLQAIHNHANSKGVKAALEEFSFEPVQITTSKAKLATLREEDVSAQVESRVQSTLNDFAKELQACLSIASVGINKNFWRTSSNPLKAALVEQFKAAGFRNPEKIVDAAFASGGDDYNRVLLSKAFEIFDKPVEHRNTLATELEDVNYQNMSLSGDDEDDEVEDDDDEAEELEAALASSMRPTNKHVVKTASVHGGANNVIALAQETRKTHGSLF